MDRGESIGQARGPVAKENSAQRRLFFLLFTFALTAALILALYGISRIAAGDTCVTRREKWGLGVTTNSRYAAYSGLERCRDQGDTEGEAYFMRVLKEQVFDDD